jgi:hypothetical protein
VQATLRKQAYELVRSIIQEWYDANEDPNQASSSFYDKSMSKKDWKALFSAAAKQIREPSPPRVHNQNKSATYFYYGHQEFKLAHAALLYIMRPNFLSRKFIQSQVRQSIFPSSLSDLRTSHESSINDDDHQSKVYDSSIPNNTIWIGLPIRGKKNYVERPPVVQFHGLPDCLIVTSSR